MILFIVLLITLVALAVFLAFALGVGGALAIVIFGDVIVCACLIIWIMKRLAKRR